MTQTYQNMPASCIRAPMPPWMIRHAPGRETRKPRICFTEGHGPNSFISALHLAGSRNLPITLLNRPILARFGLWHGGTFKSRHDSFCAIKTGVVTDSCEALLLQF